MKEIWRPKDLVCREECPLCGSPATGAIVTKRWDGLPLRRCCNCAVLFLDPAPSESVLMSCYGPEYFRSSRVSRRIGPAVDYRISAADIETGNVKGYAELTSSLEPRGKAILEVGCATGALLASLRKHSPSLLVGIDIAEQQVAYGREHYGLDLRCTKLEEAGFAAGEFDLIIMLDVIEHVWNTRSFFSAAARCLKRDGALLIRTPNADSYWIAGRRWNYLHCGLEHVVYLSAASLAILAHDHDMVIERIETQGYPAALPYLHRSTSARLLCEPVKVVSNRLWRWRLAFAPECGIGLDMYAIMRKHSSDLALSMAS